MKRGENRSTRRKTSRSREENQQQTQPTYCAEFENRSRATSVGGECSHNCAIPAPHVMEARRPDIIVIDKKERKGIIKDKAVPADVREGENEREKVEKMPGFEERDRKIVETQNVRSGTRSDRSASVTKGFDRWIEKLAIPLNVGVMQKNALLGTARILRKM